MPNTRSKTLLLQNNFVTLPKYLLSNPGAEIEGFENAADWIGVSGGTIANNAAEFRTGTQSIKASINIGANFVMQKVVNWNFGGSAPRMRLFVYLHNDMSHYSNFRVYVGSVLNLASHFWFTRTRTQLGVKQGWNVIEINQDDWTAVGGESWSNTIVKIQITCSATAGNAPEISYDSLVSGVIGVPAVMITFDDGIDDVYDVAYQYMANKRARSTAYIVTDNVGTPGMLTLAQLLTLDRDGWSIANHTTDHTDLTTLGLAAAQARIADAKTALDGWGLTKASTHVAYPGGVYNETVLSAMANESMLTGVVVNQYANPMSTLYGDNNYTIGRLYIQNTTTLATVKTAVNNALFYRRVASLLFHQLVAAPGLPTEWAISDFCALIDYIVQRKIPFLTINDFYDAQTRFITVPLG